MKREDSLQTAISCMLIRGGTSKGAYFLAADLPAEQAALGVRLVDPELRHLPLTRKRIKDAIDA